jgi:Zn-dependent metalloprotease
LRDSTRDGREIRRAAGVLSAVFAVLAASASESRAQGGGDPVAAALGHMRSASGAGVRATRSRQTGLLTFVSAKGLGIPVADRGTPMERAEAFVDAYGTAFGLRDASQVRLLRAPTRDALGVDHVRLRQVVGDVPVVGAELLVHLRGARVLAANGKALPDLEGFDTSARLSAVQAEQIARGFCEKKLAAAEAVLSEARLEILNRAVFEGARRPTQLAWFVEATGPGLREYIWIDARHGGVALHFSQLDKARNRSIYTANSSWSLPGSLVGVEDVAPAGDADATAAYNFAGDTYDYFLAEHGRDSYDGLGAPLVSTVHYCPGATSCPYQNAFWDGVQMVYGEGFSKADDVDAHELTHAVTEHTANLYYYMQSGALNESLSDMFGEAVDLWNTDRGDPTRRGNDTAAVRWLMGEDVPGLGAIRSMMNPNQFGDPGKTSDTQYSCDNVYGDNGGVHTNSGVPNHAFALSVDGGTYNGITVSGIGLRKAAQIQYRVLTQYLTSAADFLDYYDAVGQACGDLVGGAAGITASDCLQVRRALDAVQIAAPALCHQAVVPDLCPVGKVASNVFFDDFESGLGNWSLTQTAGSAADQWELTTGYATSGTHMVMAPDPSPYYYGYTSSDVQAAMTSNVLIPTGDVRLQFNHAYDLESWYDGGVVEYSTDNGVTWLDATSFFSWGRGAYPEDYTGYGPLAGRSVFAWYSSGYTASQLNLTSLSGQSARFRFRLGANETVGYWGWAIDDVRLYQCVDAGLPTLTINDVTVREGDAASKGARFTVALSAPIASAVTVQYATSDLTATAGSDYVASSGTITINAGALTASRGVSVLGDATVEGDETFQVTLSSPVNAVVGDGTGIGTIVENDGVPEPPTTSTWAIARQGMSSQWAIAYGAGLYVSVGYGGDLWTSPDGVAWSRRHVPSGPYPVDADLYGATYGGGQFVAVGACCSSLYKPMILTSPDGTSWTERDSGAATADLSAVGFGGGLYVAVGSSGTILTSPDAVTWTKETSGTTQTLNDVSYGGGAFVAVGNTATILLSVDGVTWTPQASTASSLYSVTHTGTQFVAVDSSNGVFTSPDGMAWTQRTVGGYPYFRSVASNAAGALVAVGSSSVYTSPDGVTWTQRTLPAVGPGGSKYLYAVGYGPSGFVAAGWSGALFTSSDGATWVSRQMVSSRSFNDVAYDGTRFCAVGNYGAIARSFDGVTWTNVKTVPGTPPSDSYYSHSAITRGPSLFVAVGAEISTSPDCAAWTARSVSVPVTSRGWGHSFYDVAHGAGRYVAVGSRYMNGTQVGMIQTSADGVDWADLQVAGLEDFVVRSVGFGAGRFLASGYRSLDGMPVLLTSEDGLQWAQAPTPPLSRNRALYDFLYAYGTFVANDGGQPWTSPDGINWAMFDYSGLDSWGFSNFTSGSSRFLGVGYGAWESLDGNSWTPQATPAKRYLYGAAYSESLDRFVAVGDGVIEYTSDVLPSVSVEDVSLSEDGGPARFTVSLSEPGGYPVSVQYATANGTAVSPRDYAAASGTLVFAPGETEKTFDVLVVADGVGEGSETFTVTLSGATNASLGDSAGEGTILDSPAAPRFHVGSASGTEGTGGTTTLSISVTLVDGTNAATVRYATANGTAVAGEDYVAQGGVLTFAPGVTSQDVLVPVLPDALDEGDETFTLNLSAPSNADIGTGSGSGTIVDDDTGGLIEFAAASHAVNESGLATIQVRRTGSLAAGESVVYAASDGTAVAGSDYTVTTGTLTFAAGVTTLSFTVPITVDTLVEGPETLSLALSSAGGGAAVGPLSGAVLTIKDDDFGGALKLSAATYAVKEAGPVATVTVQRTGGAGSGVSVDYATSNGSAAAGSDFTAASGTLSFAAGVLTKTFTVPITNDALAEGPETFNVALSMPRGGATLGAPATAAVTITDDEPMVQFSLAGYTASEAAPAATITVARIGGTAAFTVDYATSNGSALAGSDYGAVSGTLSFAAGVASRTFTIPITSDTQGEANETVFLALSNATGAYFGPRRTAVLTITDNEPVVQLSATAYTVAEAGPAATITVVRTGGTAAFTVDYSVSSGSATAGDDFTAVSGTLSFPAGVMSKAISVPILNDAWGENSEYFWLDLYNASGALLGPRSDARVTITDNEPVVQFSASAYTVSEAAGVVKITLVRSGSPAPFTASYSMSSGTATSGSDFTASSEPLTFAAGVMSRTFTVPITLDGLIESSEYFYVYLYWASGASGGTRNYAKVTITEASPVVQFSAATYAGAEASGKATITVTRTGTAPISVDYASTGGTATAGSDFTAASGTLSFPAGVMAKAITVPIASDGVADSGETVNLALSNAVGAGIGARGTAVLTITDASPVVQLSAATYTVKEAGPVATITVVRTGTAPFSVQYATSDGTAVAGSDHTAASGTLSFAAGVVSRTFTVSITNDTVGEANETVFVTLSNPVGATVGPRGSAVLTITDDEPVVLLTSTAYTVSEAGPVATITVVRTGTAPFTVQYGTSDGTAAAGGDYTTSAGGLSFAAGVASRTITVPIANDTLDEANETVFVALSNPVGASLGARGTALLAITDDDTAGTIAFGAPVVTVGESGSTATVTLTRTGGLASGARVVCTTSDGTASAGGDYTAATGTVVFGVGELSRTISIPIANDGVVEPSETVLLALSNPAGGASLGAQQTATLVIVDND